ncbi:MAG: chromosomal replication initiator protein DnaA [Planctomycetota bacterium]|jgi:chromosomal replication initiator protein
MVTDNQSIWARVLGDLATKVRPELVSDWLADLELTSCGPEQVAVTAPSSLHAKLVRDHYSELLAEGFERVMGSRPEVSVSARTGTPKRGPTRPTPSPFNPSFTLEGFIEGNTCRLALAACRAIAGRPGDLYNPLFVHGASGTGKTHLLQGVCRDLAERMEVLYLTGDEFSSRIAVGRDEAAALRRDLRAAQVLAIDDVQTLQGREASQEELFHAFNALYNRNGQLIFAADLPPNSLSGLPERLTSRFTWGLTVEVEPPLFESRLQILAAKAKSKGLTFEMDVLEVLASSRTSNVRELEGLLARLAARSELAGVPPTREMASELASLTSEDELSRQAPSTERIQRVVASAYGLRPNDLLGPSRTRSVALARHVAIYLVRQLTDLPIQEIGGHFGGRDHSTVNYAIGKITAAISEDKALASTVRRLRQEVAGEKRVNI